MAEIITIARPYAEALYRLAVQDQAIDRWSDALSSLSAVATAEEMKPLIANPNITRQNIEQVFFGVLGPRLDAQGKNLVRLLLENNRLAILPEIAAHFETLKAEQSGEMDANITSAFPLDETQIKDIVSLLEKRFARKVHVKVDIDADLIGGVKINAGDVVIDASVRGQLQNMAFALKR